MRSAALACATGNPSATKVKSGAKIKRKFLIDMARASYLTVTFAV